MVNIKVLEERPITLAELKERLSENKNPIPKGIKTQEYLKSIPVVKEKKAQELKEKINALGITRLKEKQIIKVIDIMPQDTESLKIILSMDITLKQEDLQKILNIITS